MNSKTKRIIRNRQIQRAIALLTVILLPTTIIFWLMPNFWPFAIILTILTIISFVGYFILNKSINDDRRKIKQSAPRQGHQGEPGAWRCDCGRYNTAYRSVCLSCGSKKPGTNLY